LKNARNSEIYLCGHSAGAHLASMMLYTDFVNKFNVSSESIKGLILVSGIYDLIPLIQTEINENLKMDLIEANNCSPLLKPFSFISDSQKKEIRILLTFGEFESNSFKSQSDFYKKVKYIL
jgi:arylformamidase